MLTIYVTYPDLETAESISRAVIEDKLAACANIFPPIQSLFWWDGDVQSENEVAVLYKTTRENFKKLEETITAKHPYDVPCIVAWDIAEGHAPFLDWIKQSTQSESVKGS